MQIECSVPNRKTGRAWQKDESIFTMVSFFLALLSLMKSKGQKKITCWSEGASPGRPPSTITDPATPLIQAIRSELQRFQRRQNTGVTIVSDPDLLDNESRA